MRIVVDQNIPAVRETFALRGHVMQVDGRGLAKELLRDVEALIIRSVTRVNAELLDESSVGFVGTATIGIDHLDTAYLDRSDICWANAPGCNADAAAQYTVAMILLACRRLDKAPTGCTVGIVGRGNVGSRVEQILRTLGVATMACDPPLADDGEPGLSSIEAICRCDIISLHTPLTRTGPYPTLHMIDQAFLDRLDPGTLLVNTARGNVINGPALQSWLEAGRGHAALDVWPGEPAIGIELLQQATVASPHVAGYSLDGKYRGTAMIYEAFCAWLNITGSQAVQPAGMAGTLAAGTVRDAILQACPVERDDRAMRGLESLDADLRASAFDALRRDYPERRDFSGWWIPEHLARPERELLSALGFRPSSFT